MDVLRTAADIAARPGGILVPTMGALHEGHAALFRLARMVADRTGRDAIATIFVNPTQFNESSDFDHYPRDEAGDLALAEAAGLDAVVIPPVDVVYPSDDPISVPPLPQVATEPRLEDASRPGHLEGVAQVVARLFDLFAPRGAVFGEKDWQQLKLVESMVTAVRADAPNRWPELEIFAGPTEREDDGLAMSSRNRRLDAEARAAARGIPRAMQVAHAAQQPRTAEDMMRETLEMHGLTVEYAVVRDANTLMPVSDFTRPTRGLIAARVGEVRLIDNGPMTIWS